MKFKTFDDFLNESESYPNFDLQSPYPRVRYIDIKKFLDRGIPSDDEIKKFQEKTKLKKGDPIVVTGTRFVYKVELDPFKETGFSKGDSINEDKFEFVEWPDKAYLQKIATINRHSLSYFSNPREWNNRQEESSTVFSHLPFGICKNGGKKFLLTLNFYNPNYVKSEKAKEVFDIDEVKTLAKFAAKEMGISDSEVVGTEPDLVVVFTTYYVTVRNHTGSEQVNAAGPFSTEKEAQKKLESIGKINGDLDYDKLKKFRLRVESKESPLDIRVTKGVSQIPVKEFMSSIDKKLQQKGNSQKNKRFCTRIKIRNMKKFLTYNEFLNEDGAFAAVGAAPAGNVSGMGDVSAPTSTSTGSGDAWPSLFKPFTLAQKRKRRKKRKNKRS